MPPQPFAGLFAGLFQTLVFENCARSLKNSTRTEKSIPLRLLRLSTGLIRNVLYVPRAQLPFKRRGLKRAEPQLR